MSQINANEQNIINAVTLFKTLYEEIALLSYEVIKQFKERGFTKLEGGKSIGKENSNSLDYPDKWLYTEGALSFYEHASRKDSVKAVTYFAFRLDKTEYNNVPIVMMGVAQPIDSMQYLFKKEWPQDAFGPRENYLQRYLISKDWDLKNTIQKGNLNSELIYTFNEMGDDSFAWFRHCIHFTTPLLSISEPEIVVKMVERTVNIWKNWDRIKELNNERSKFEIKK